MVKESIGGNFYLFFAGKSCRREIIEWWYTYKKVIESVLFLFFCKRKSGRRQYNYLRHLIHSYLYKYFCYSVPVALQIFPLSEKIENINDQYWTLRAEEVSLLSC